MSEVLDLLRSIVRIPSVSGDEGACRDHLLGWFAERGLEARAVGRNLVASREGGGAGERGLLLCTHIDTVPAGPGWTKDPWSGDLVGGRVHGRGANDAKASVAAMAVAFANTDPPVLAGRLVLALVCDEETGGEGLEAIAAGLPPFDAAVIGEPTELDVCAGQRGLLRASVVAHGRSCHASRPWEGVNAIEIAARDVLAIQSLAMGDPDPLLGPATIQATMIEGGTRPNVVPGECTIQVDGRSTPGCDNERMLSLLRAAVTGEVRVKSTRFRPVLAPPGSAIVEAARAASPTGRVRAFQGVSDLFWVRRVPGVVMGPGTSDQSHVADESVAIEQVEAAATAYGALIRRYLGAGGAN
jgi:acetylornithine deacetylase